MDMSRNITEDCRELGRKIQNLVDERVLTIDLLNQQYEIIDHFKVHHAGHPYPP